MIPKIYKTAAHATIEDSWRFPINRSSGQAASFAGIESINSNLVRRKRPHCSMSLLSDEVARSAERSVLCWLASVDATGQPSVSPKEIYAVFDQSHIVIANIASPRSVANIHHSPKVCVSFVDIFVQKGFKVSGNARNVGQDHADFKHWVKPLRDKAGPRFPIHSVIVVEAIAVEPVLAPSYRLFPGETTERSQIQAACRTYGVFGREGGA